MHDARVIYLAFDRDTPGQQAARSLARLLERRARLVILPEGVKDVNELGLRQAGRLVFQACVVEAARGGGAGGGEWSRGWEEEHYLDAAPDADRDPVGDQQEVA